MASRYLVITGNYSAIATWSATDGGAGGASVPTSIDDVFLTAASGVVTLTVDVASACLSMNSTGFTGTLAGAVGLSIFGNLTMGAGMTRTFTGSVTFASVSTGRTITMNGITFASGGVSFNGIGGGWTLQDTFNTTTAALSITNGAFISNNQTITCAGFSSNITGIRTVTLGTSTVNCTTFTISTLNNLTFSAASSTINATGTFAGGQQTYNIVTLSTTSLILGDAGNTFATLTVTGLATATSVLTIAGNLTVTGTFTMNGNSVLNRTLIQSNIKGVQRTITAAVVVITNADFQNIKGAGAGNWNLSAITGLSGDAGNNSGIIFTTPANQTSTGTASFTWSTHGWTSRVPLPQDNVFITNAFVANQTVTANMTRLGKSITTSCTGAPIFSLTVAGSIFGSLDLTGFGSWTSNTPVLTFEGIGAHTIYSPVTIGSPVTLTAPRGTLTMTANTTIVSARTLTVTLGTFDTSTFILSTGLLTLGAGSNFVARLNLNAGAHLLTGTGIVFTAISTLRTSVLNAGTSSLRITNTTATIVNIECVKKLYNVHFDRGASTAINTIAYSGIFNEFKDTGTASHTLRLTAGVVMAVNTFVVSGNAGALITIDSSVINTKVTILQKTGTVNCNYITSRDLLVGGGAIWNIGANSTVSTGNYFGAGFGWAESAVVTDAVRSRYMVASGNYTTASVWSTTSGGAGGASAPIGEIIKLNAASGAVTLTINISSNCGDIDCTGFTGTLTGTSVLNVTGSLKFVAGMSYTQVVLNALSFQHSGTIKTLDWGTKVYQSTGIRFTGVDNQSINLLGENGFGDTWVLISDYTTRETDRLTTIGITSVFTFVSGTFDANGFNVTTGLVASSFTTSRTIKLGTGTWDLIGTGVVWSCATSNGLTIVPGTSLIKLSDHTVPVQYFNLPVTTTTTEASSKFTAFPAGGTYPIVFRIRSADVPVGGM